MCKLYIHVRSYFRRLDFDSIQSTNNDHDAIIHIIHLIYKSSGRTKNKRYQGTFTFIVTHFKSFHHGYAIVTAIDRILRQTDIRLMLTDMLQCYPSVWHRLLDNLSMPKKTMPLVKCESIQWLHFLYIDVSLPWLSPHMVALWCLFPISDSCNYHTQYIKAFGISTGNLPKRRFCWNIHF